MSQLYLYILMRIDIPSQGAGRAAAQASHAANAFWKTYGYHDEVRAWANETPQGFGTAIVLGVTNEELKDILRKTTINIVCDSVIDPDYVISVPSEVIPYIDKDKLKFFKQSSSDPTKYLFSRSEVTCGYVFGDKEILFPILGHLPLYS